MNKWDSRFIDLAKYVSKWSKDPSTGIGCVIADAENRVVTVGFNGLPHFMEDHPDILENRENKYATVLHAEYNALDSATFEAYKAPFRIYITRIPCNDCVLLMCYAKHKIVEIHYVEDVEFESRWVMCEHSKQSLSDKNIKLIKHKV